MLSPIHDVPGQKPLAPPPFAPSLVAAYELPASAGSADVLPDPERLHPRVRGAAPLLVAVRPLLDQARSRLRAGLRKIARDAVAAPFDPEVAQELWLQDLPGDMLALLDRTLVLEMHVARMQGVLSGETPEQRFASFVERLRDPAVVLSIFREYPVLAADLASCADQAVSFGLEVFRHLAVDWTKIREAFSPERDPGPVVAMETGAGDPHRQGRAVVILQFASGLKVVYKPKALAVDVHFQELVTWLNTRGLTPPLRTLHVLDRGAHGWIEHVTPATCDSEAAVRRFYRRKGALILLSYVLGATDFHYENVLAIGEHPVLIDLETLLQPYPKDRGHEGAEAGASLHRSVLRSGLLPHWGGVSVGLGGVDISGVGTKPGQKTSVGMPTWEGEGTDALRFTRKVVELPPGHNRATLRGADVDVVELVDDIVAGFIDAYRLVVASREELLAEGGPIARFAGDEIRLIVRSTQRYALLRYESRHPNVLRDPADRDRGFDRLSREVSQVPSLARLIPSERADLWCGDIPMFFTTPRETTHRDSRGAPIDGFIEEPSLDQVTRGIRDMGEEDLERQLWFLRAALSVLETRVGSGRRRARRTPEETAPAVSRSRLLQAARSIGERLARTVIADDELVYLGATPRDGGWGFGPVDNDLYQGNAGIALFLGYLGAITGDSGPTALARATLRQISKSLEGSAARVKAIGAFEGLGGLVHAMTHLGVLWDDPALLAQATALAGHIEAFAPQDDRLDLVSGAAGAIAALLGLHAVAPSEAVLRAAVACGDRLIQRAENTGSGIAWPCMLEVLAPLTGFAHGTAGMAWALDALAKATGQARFAEIAEGAIAYERSAFVPGQGWPDWRKIEGTSLTRPTFETAWCHGAPGIGLARLGRAAAGEEAALAELRFALDATMRQRFAPDHSLCHGDLAGIELFSEAHRALGEPALLAEAERRAAVLLDSVHRDGPLCGVSVAAEVPGLMTGISGIGYGLLRIAEPARVPNVLLLAPPPVHPR